METGIESVDMIFMESEEKMDKAINNLIGEYKLVRAGRANPHILDKVQVDYYGQLTSINKMANITTPEARLLVINVWDKSAMKDVEKAIQNSGIGINPNNDGQVIRLLFPELTQDRRKELTKEIKQFAEETKIVIRNARRDALDGFKKLEKNSEITEDDLATYTKEVDKMLQTKTEFVDKEFKEKEREIMEI